MASWVITIAKAFPEHWDFARRDSVWDMTKQFPVQRGDDVFFRLSGGPLLGWTRAREDARPLTAKDEVPWTDGRDPYRSRFTFELVSSAVEEPSTWNLIGPRLTMNLPLQGPRRWDDPADRAVLRSFFSTPLEQAAGLMFTDTDAEVDAAAPGLDALTKEQREFVEAMRVVRQGQTRFRDALIDIYGGCAVTGTQLTEVLEGAHIMPYKGRQSNDVRNGLPLRRDIHRLFDRHLLRLQLPAMTVLGSTA